MARSLKRLSNIKFPSYTEFGAQSITFCRYNGSKAEEKSNLWSQYQATKQRVKESTLMEDQNPWSIFANNELDLAEIDVYGFDYDFTLAEYRKSLDFLIFDLAKESMIGQHKYPKELRDMQYVPYFAVRGLHCDILKGLLLKIDAFHNIQLGTVYRGLQQVPDDEVRRLYEGLHVSLDQMSGYYGKGEYMTQFIDMFARPEITLLSNIIEFFESQSIPYDPEYVFYDVRQAVQQLHTSGKLHREISAHLDRHLGVNPRISNLLRRLSAAGKHLFMITNSGYDFVNCGMKYIVGDDWQSLFDVIICNARKPKFFRDTHRPFRRYNPAIGVRAYERINQLSKGQIFEEGNLYQLREFTGWYGSRVLYFGDHIYNDLTDANLKHGWRTAAIIPELEYEIQVQNGDTFKKTIRWLVALQNLIESMQDNDDPESKVIVETWLKERDQLRSLSKNLFNSQFGSVFRTYHNPTYFTRRLSRFADCYMASVGCLQHHSLTHCFYPRRYALPHESAAKSS